MVVVNPDTSFSRQSLPSQIVAVTVYADQALITRRTSVSLTGNERELVITPLPVNLETDSIRVSGTGSVEVLLLGVRCDRFYTTEPVSERVAQLTRQIQQLEAQKRHLQAQIDALILQSNFISGLREKSEDSFAQSLSRKNLSLSEILDFLNFIGSQFSEYAIASGECQSQLQELDRQLEALHTALQKLNSPATKESLSLIVAVDVKGEGQFELEVSYLVNCASWMPIYDLRFDSKNNTINLSYLAEITQNTGEDWLDVNLTLSTAKPGLGTIPPGLEPWYINTLVAYNHRQRRQVELPPAMASGSMSREAALEYNQDEEFVTESYLAAEPVGAKIAKEGNVVTFKLNSGGNIPSDGTPHKRTIFNDDYPCSLEYVAMPRLVTFVYLQAKVKNSADGATLLPGKANIFRDNTFISSTQLENIVPGAEFKVNLGIDEGLKIERNLVERHVDKKLMSNQRRIVYAYRVVITNLLNQEVSLKLTEQLPISRHEQIKVRFAQSNPQVPLGEMGILAWGLTLPPQEKQEIYYQFTVDHPPEFTVVGLDI